MIDYKAQYLLFCKDLNNCTTKDEVKHHNAAMKKLGKLFQQLKTEPQINKTFLLELLKYDNDQVSSLVAAHCLGLGVYIPEAKKVLSALAKNKANPVLAFEAQATLDVWKQQGYLDF